MVDRTTVPTGQATHILLGGIPLMIHRPENQGGGAAAQPQHDQVYGPSIEGQQQTTADVPVTWTGFGGDSLNTRRKAPNQTKIGRNVTTRNGLAMPAGKIQEVALNTLGVPLGLIFQMIQYGTDLFIIHGQNSVLKLTGGSSPAQVATSGLTDFFGRSAVVFQHSGGTEYLYVGGTSVSGASSSGIVRFDGTTWTQYTTNSNIKRVHLAKVYWTIPDPLDGTTSGGYRLIGTSNDGTSFQYCMADPFTSGNWSSAIKIASAQYPITTIAAAPQVVYFVCRDGVKSVNSLGHAPNLTPHWLQMYGLDNGESSVVYGDSIFAANHRGLEWIRPEGDRRQDYAIFCGPGVHSDSQTGVGQRTTALTIDQGWLVAATYNEKTYQSHIFYGKPRDVVGIDGPGPMYWSGSERTLSNRRVTALYIMSPPSVTGLGPKLYIAATDSGNTVPYLYIQDLPRSESAYQDWLNGGPMQYETDADLELGIETWGDVARKYMTGYEAIAENCSEASNRNIDVQAKFDSTGSYASQGYITESPHSSFQTVASGSTGFEVEHKIVFHGTATQPTILRSLKILADIAPDQRATRKYLVEISSGKRMENGAIDDRDPEDVWQSLSSLRLEDLQDFTDEYGIQFQVRIDDRMPVKTLRDGRGGQVRLVELTLRLIQQISLYGAATYYTGSGRYS